MANTKSQNGDGSCVITPNSINNEVKKLGEKFYFGKDDPKAIKKNHFNFNDESIGVRQFEIAYNSGIKFYTFIILFKKIKGNFSLLIIKEEQDYL